MSLSSLTNHPSPAPSRKRILPIWLIPLSLFLGFLIVFALLFGRKLAPAISVQTAQAITLRGQHQGQNSSRDAQQNEELLFQASGWIEANPYTIEVPALINGIVDEVYVLGGDSVTKGQLLASLIDDEARIALEQAERKIETHRSRIESHCSQIPQIKARLTSVQAKVDAEKARLAELVDRANRLKELPEGAISKAEIIAALLQVKRQEALLIEAESAIPEIQSQLATIDLEKSTMDKVIKELESERDLAKLTMDRHQITSPMAGRILHLHAHPGKKRMLDMDSSKSATIVELYDPESVQARIDVPLNEAINLAVGQRVTLSTDLLNDVTLSGTVTRIEGEADLQRNTIQVKVAIEKPDDRLRPEMLVRGQFYSLINPKQSNENNNNAESESSSRLRIFGHQSAFFKRTGQNAKAWIVDSDSKAALRDITLGRSQKDDHLEVISGVYSGEQLILPPFEQLKTGTRVKPTLSNN